MKEYKLSCMEVYLKEHSSLRMSYLLTLHGDDVVTDGSDGCFGR